MQVFLSWSGDKSGEIAQALFGWLPLMLQAVKPWISKRSISAGSNWLAELNNALAKSEAGIICVTRENLKEPWMLFESAALWKTVDKPFVCPYLIDLSTAELSGPLSQFQGLPANKEGTWKLVETLNSKLSQTSQLHPETLPKVFKAFWPQLEGQIKEAIKNDRKASPRSPTQIEQVLLGVRELAHNQERLMEEIGSISDLVETRLLGQDNPYFMPVRGFGVPMTQSKQLRDLLAESLSAKDIVQAAEQRLADAMKPAKRKKQDDES